MNEVCCQRCGATDHVKNGIVRGFQRYLCLSCGCNFTMTPPRGKPFAMKALALLLYAMGNVSFGSIAHSRRQRRGGSQLGPRRSAQASRAINQG
jgi:transposase-like protein